MESAMNSRVINAGGTHGRVTRTLYRALLRSGRTVRHAFAMSFCCGCAARLWLCAVAVLVPYLLIDGAASPYLPCMLGIVTPLR